MENAIANADLTSRHLLEAGFLTPSGRTCPAHDTQIADDYQITIRDGQVTEVRCRFTRDAHASGSDLPAKSVPAFVP